MKKGRLQLKDIPDYEALWAVWCFELAVRFNHRPTRTPFQELAWRYPSRLVLKKLENLWEKGYIDYGVSIRTPWLTQEGKGYLAELCGIRSS